MEGPPRANAAQLAARKIKERPKGRKGGAAPTPSLMSSAPQWNNPMQSQGSGPFGGAATGGGLFGGSVQATGTFDFAVPSGPSFAPPSFGGNTNNIFGASNGAMKQESDRPVDDRPSKKQFGVSTAPTSQSTFQTPDLFAQSQQSNIFGSANKPQGGGNPFSFGSTLQATSNPGTSFPSSSTTTQSQPSGSMFPFGAPSSTPTPPAINFGSNPAPGNATNNVFNLGQPTSQPPAQPISSTPGFNFGSSSPQDKPQSTPFLFGQTSSQPVTSSVPTVNPTPASTVPTNNIFGGSQVQSPQPTNIFGKPSSEPQNIFANLKPAPSEKPVFGSGEQGPAKTNNLFGIQTSAVSQSGQEPAKSTTNLFGSQAPVVSQPVQESAKSTTNIFGSQAPVVSQPAQEPTKTTSSLFGPQAQQVSQPSVSLFAKPTQPTVESSSPGDKDLVNSKGSFKTTKSQTPPTGGLFGHAAPQQSQSTNIFGNATKSTSDPLGTLNQPFNQPAIPNINGVPTNSLENKITIDGNSSPFATTTQASSTNAATTSKLLPVTTPALLPSANESAPDISTSPWEKAAYTNPVAHTPEVFSLIKHLEASEAGSVERDADGPDEPEQPPSFLENMTDNTFADLDGDLDAFPSLFPGMVYASKYPIEKMVSQIPPEFTPEQRVEFYTACRMRALNKALQRYFNSIEITDNIFPAIRFYDYMRQTILSRVDEELTEEIHDLKRKAPNRGDEENEQPSKRTKQPECSTISYPQLSQQTAIGLVAPPPSNLLQPGLNGGTASSVPSTSQFQASTAPAAPATSTSKGKRKGEELTKDSYENESSSPLKRAKIPTPNGMEGGSNTSNIFKKLLDSPTKPSPARQSLDKSAFSSRDSNNETPRFNLFGNLPVPALSASQTPTGTTSSTSLFPSFTPSATKEPSMPESATGAAAAAPEVHPTKPAPIKPPTFGTGPVNFLAQFSQQAKDSEKELMEKAKAEDMDSDDDEQEWEANYKKKRAADLKATEDLAKSKRAAFVPGKGFVFVEAGKATSSESNDKSNLSKESLDKGTNKSQSTTGLKPASSQVSSQPPAGGLFSSLNSSKTLASGTGSVLDSHKPGQPVSFGSNIFAHLSDADSGGDSGKGHEADDESADDDTEGESDSENKDPTYRPGTESKSGPGTPVEETGPGIASAKKATVPPTFGSTKQGGLFGTPSNSGTSSPGGSLFDRISKDSNGNPIREISSEEKENTKPSTTNIFGEIKNPFASLNKPVGLPADQTWKPDSPIRFGSTTPTKDAKSSAPTVNVQPATPTKPSSPFGNLFGAPKDATSTLPNGPAAGTTPFSNLFGNSSSTKSAPTTGVGFNFGASSTSSSLFPSAAASTTTSRATTPGGTTDGDSAAEGDADAEHHEQINLTSGGPGEEDEEVIYEVRAKALKFTTTGEDQKASWETKGVGPLRVLKHKSRNSVRLLLRAEPRGAVALNKALLRQVNYEVTQKTIKMPALADNGKSLETWILQVKTPEIAKRLGEIMESNKNPEQT